MNTTALNRKITLQRRTQGGGRSGITVVSEKTVWASARTPGLSFQNSAQAAGYKADITVQIWRSEYSADTYTHAVIDGPPYRISGAGAGLNDLFVRLTLEKQ